MNGRFESVVRGGTVVNATGRARLDIFLADGRIAGLMPPGRPELGETVIDATGLLVLPGMVDTHVHLMDPGDATREDFPTGTGAALRQGVTSIVEHTHSWPVTSLERLSEKRAHLRGRSYVDYGLAAHVFPESFNELEPLWRGGVAFFKIFTCATHGIPAVSGRTLSAVLSELGRLSARALVHCEDDTLTVGIERELREIGRSDPGILVEWRSREAELVAVHATALLARRSGAKVTIAHASSSDVLETVSWHQLHGAPIVAETCPQYLLLREDEVYEHGALRKFTPPARIRDASDESAMWAAFNSGRVHHLSTDHAPSTREQKASGSIWDVHFGLPGLDTTLPLMLDAAIAERTSFERVVETYSTVPAGYYGMRRKGRIAPGYDADLALVDPHARRILRDEDIHSVAGWTPYVGREVRGAGAATLLRGRVEQREGRLVGEPSGKHLLGPGFDGSDA